jgi:uncharacterized protein YgiM (DUF1202 family)
MREHLFLKRLVTFVAAATLCNACGREQRDPVVCSKSPVWLSDASDDERSARHLETGDELKVLGTFDNNLYFVELPSRTTGWIHKWDVCSKRELKRRRNKGTMPDAVVVVSHRKNDTAMTHQEAHVILESGLPDSKVANAFWLDGSTAGMEFVLVPGSKKIKGRPGAFYFRLPDGELSELTTWDEELAERR